MVVRGQRARENSVPLCDLVYLYLMSIGDTYIFVYTRDAYVYVIRRAAFLDYATSTRRKILEGFSRSILQTHLRIMRYCSRPTVRQ